MNIGPSDIVGGIKLAYRIYEYGFSQQNSATVRYRVFKNDINHFRDLLSKLEVALEQAQERYQQRGSVLASEAYDPLGNGIENERRCIIGDFLATLTDCEKHLARNARHTQQASSVGTNIMLNVQQDEQQIERLRSRLRFHAEKIRLVTDRVSVTLLTDIDARVDDILALTDRNLEISQETQAMILRFYASWRDHTATGVQPAPIEQDQFALSDEIASRFQQSLSVGLPPSTQPGLPLSATFDAVLSHYHRMIQIEDPTDEKHLIFLKVRWLIDRMKEGADYQNARPGYYYKRAIFQIEKATLATARKRLLAYDDAVLLALDDACFQIWPVTTLAGESSSTPDPLLPGPNEEQVVAINLVTSGARGPDTVTVFRSSDNSMRVVRQSDADSNRTIIIGQTVHIREDKLIPRYALPTLHSPCLELVIFSRNVETVYRFESLQDLYSFQAALIGYVIKHDQENIQCQFSESMRSLNCSGRVQLWQNPVGQQSSGPGDSTSPSSGSQTSYTMNSGTRRDSLHSSLTGTSTIFPMQDGWRAGSIKLPVITIISQVKSGDMKGKFAAISIELGPGVQVDSKACACHREYDGCLRLVLTAPTTKKKKLAMRIVYSDIDAGRVPIATTFDIFPLSTPSSSRPRASTTNYTNHLLLVFQTLSEKVLFHQELDARFSVRDVQIKHQRSFEKDVWYRADHPQRHT